MVSFQHLTRTNTNISTNQSNFHTNANACSSQYFSQHLPQKANRNGSTNQSCNYTLQCRCLFFTSSCLEISALLKYLSRTSTNISTITTKTIVYNHTNIDACFFTPSIAPTPVKDKCKHIYQLEVHIFIPMLIFIFSSIISSLTPANSK